MDVSQTGQLPSTSQSVQGDGARGQTEKMVRTFRGILNKLTPEKFEALVKHVDELPIDNEERLKTVIQLIVDNATEHQSYSVVFANMCHHMKGLTVTEQSGNGFTTFHKVLLRQCQREFEENELLKKQEGEINATQNEAEGQQRTQQQTKGKSRDRLLGISRFLGELFNLKMVAASVINSCLVTMILDDSEFSLECFCKLLSTVGQGLDTEAERPNLNKYYRHICHLIQERKTSTRIRCLMLDLYDLRKNNWVPRRQEEVPKAVKVDQAVKQVGAGQQLQIRERQNKDGEIKPVRVEAQEKKSSSKDCDRKQLPHSDHSSTPQSPPARKRSQKRNVGRKQTEPIIFLDEKKKARRMTVEQSSRSKPSEGATESEKRPSEPAQDVEVTMREDCNEGEVYETVKRLLQEKRSNKEVEDWIQENLNTKQRSSVEFIRALMRSVGESLIVFCGVHKVDAHKLLQRAGLLKMYIINEQQQLVALNLLQELMASMEHPRCLLRMFFDLMLDQDIIKDTALFTWESSTDSETLASVSKFFVFLRLAKRQLSCS